MLATELKGYQKLKGQLKDEMETMEYRIKRSKKILNFDPPINDEDDIKYHENNIATCDAKYQELKNILGYLTRCEIPDKEQVNQTRIPRDASVMVVRDLRDEHLELVDVHEARRFRSWSCFRFWMVI